MHVKVRGRLWELFLLHLAVSLIVSAAVCTENQPVAGQKPRAIPVSVALLDEGVLALQVCSSHPGFCGSGDHSHLLRHVVWQVLYPLKHLKAPNISFMLVFYSHKTLLVVGNVVGL